MWTHPWRRCPGHLSRVGAGAACATPPRRANSARARDHSSGQDGGIDCSNPRRTVKITLLTVGRPRGAAAELVAEYEKRAGRYFTLEVGDVKEESFRRAGDAARVRDEEGTRLLARVPPGAEIVALHEAGKQW